MIENKQAFLQTIAQQLGRKSPSTIKPDRKWKHSPQHRVLQQASIDELVTIFIDQCQNIHTAVKQCTIAQLPTTVADTIANYNGKSVIYSDDERFSSLNILPNLASYTCHQWNAALGHENVEIAERADVGIVFSERTLAESGTILVQASPKVGRTLSFLPENSIAIVPKSSIVPRMTQAAQFLRNESRVASCINFITGPSNSADIEMNLVVGVHGPVRMTYILVEDL